MGKICNRNYNSDTLLSVKKINGIGYCPVCDKPALCHGKSVEYRVAFWALSNDSGISSLAIGRHMVFGGGGLMLPPSDADDRGRCIRLLELIPEWIDRLNEMVQYDQNKPDGMVVNSSGISADTNSWAKQIPLIKQEGKL